VDFLGSVFGLFHRSAAVRLRHPRQVELVGHPRWRARRLDSADESSRSIGPS
jgi:hypothetical protein